MGASTHYAPKHETGVLQGFAPVTSVMLSPCGKQELETMWSLGQGCTTSRRGSR
jgi:hypothetical protein